MRHNYFGRKLGRTKNERKRLFAGLVRDVILHGQIKTTLAKAKAVIPILENMISKIKKGQPADIYEVRRIINDREVIKKLNTDIKDRFADRNSGFTRIIKLGARSSDAAMMALLTFSGKPMVEAVVIPEKPKDQVPQKKDLKSSLKLSSKKTGKSAEKEKVVKTNKKKI